MRPQFIIMKRALEASLSLPNINHLYLVLTYFPKAPVNKRSTAYTSWMQASKARKAGAYIVGRESGGIQRNQRAISPSYFCLIFSHFTPRFNLANFYLVFRHLPSLSAYLIAFTTLTLSKHKDINRWRSQVYLQLHELACGAVKKGLKLNKTLPTIPNIVSDFYFIRVFRSHWRSTKIWWRVVLSQSRTRFSSWVAIWATGRNWSCHRLKTKLLMKCWLKDGAYMESLCFCRRGHIPWEEW